MQRDLSGRRLGRYEVLVQLASGGMATVYVARAQGVAGFERLVAIKVLHPHLAHDEEFISMFLDEARLAARIRHPNVVPTLDISDTQGDGYFLVMEYVEGDHLGGLLREAVRAGVQLDPAVMARVVLDALEGLGAAHALADDDGKPLGIVHRDVSPHNVLVGVDGIARITDFGVAKAEVRLSSTRDGQFKGKLSYMAPEQASTGKADQRSDLFSMGIVLWESLTGRRLFRAENNGELLNRLLHEPVPAPSAYAPQAESFDAVCLKALARDPDARFQSAAEFVEAVEAAAAKLGGLASPRAVGKLVRELLGAKIDAQQARIRQAIDALGKSELRPGLLPLPESGSTPSARIPASSTGASRTPSAVRAVPLEDATVGARPSSVQSEPSSPAQPSANSARRAVFGGLLVLALLLGVLAAAMFTSRPDRDAPTSAGPPATSPAPAAAPLPEPLTAPRPSSTPASPSTSAPSGTPSAPTDPAATAFAGVEAPGDGAVAPRASTAPRSATERRDRHRRRAGTGPREGAASDDDEELLVNPYRR